MKIGMERRRPDRSSYRLLMQKKTRGKFLNLGNEDKDGKEQA